MIVDITGPAKSDVTIEFDGSRANAKSILNVMMLAIPVGSEVLFEVDGEDEEEVVQLEFLRRPAMSWGARSRWLAAR